MASATMRNWIQQHYDYAAVFLASLLLIALWSFGAGKELWFDERFIQVISGNLFPTMFELLRFENNPPFMFIAADVWQRLFGNGEVMLRTLTLIPSVAFLFVFQRLARELAGKLVAGIAVLLASVSGLIVIQAGEFRMYPWLMLFSTLALLWTWSYAHSPRRSILVALTGVNILGLYTHYTFVAVLLFQLIWFFVNARSRWREVGVSMLVVAIAFMPWFFYSALSKVQDLSTNVGIQRIAAARWEVILLPFRFILPAWFLEGYGWLTIRILGSTIILFALSRYIMVGLLHREGAVNYGSVFIGLYVLVIVTFLTVSGLVVPKYASALLPGMIAATAIGLGVVGRKVLTWLATTSLVVIACLISFQQSRLPYVTYRAAASIVQRNEQHGDRILVYPFNDEIAVRPYYHGNLRVTGFMPLFEPTEVSLKEIVQYNFRVTLDSSNVERLRSYVDGAERVWFFYDVPPSPGYWNGDLIADWFNRNGFTATVYQDIFQNVPPLLVRYDRQ